jgi:hypothetical protein
MPIQLAPIPKNSMFSGYIWTLESEDQLARLVARVFLGRYLHVEKILAKLGPKALSFSSAAAAEAKAKLVVKTGQDPWHRDGLLFQAMSWVAAHQAADPTSSVFSLPHQIPAHKGFDGLQIQLDKHGKLSGLIISEDNPRTTITNDVWPEIQLLNGGKRQTELMQETTALLQRASVADPDQVIEGIVWKRIRSFRVSITGGPGHDADPGLSKLFKGYDTAAPGKDAAKRRAEVVCFPAFGHGWTDLLQRSGEQSIPKRANTMFDAQTVDLIKWFFRK